MKQIHIFISLPMLLASEGKMFDHEMSFEDFFDNLSIQQSHIHHRTDPAANKIKYHHGYQPSFSHTTTVKGGT